MRTSEVNRLDCARDMTFAAARDHGVFRVTEMRVRQPALDHDRLRDLRRRIRNAGGLFPPHDKKRSRCISRVTAGIDFVATPCMDLR